MDVVLKRFQTKKTNWFYPESFILTSKQCSAKRSNVMLNYYNRIALFRLVPVNPCYHNTQVFICFRVSNSLFSQQFFVY